MSKFSFNKGDLKYSFGAKLFRRIINEYKQYCKIYNQLILQDYPIFPVPDDLVNYLIKETQKGNQATIFISDILKKYSKNFKNLYLFLRGLKYIYIFNKNAYIKTKLINDPNIFAEINDSDNEILNCTLNISIVNCKNIFELKKAIQHELIHWLQVFLNSDEKTKHGLWDNLTINDFNNNDFLKFILSLDQDQPAAINNIQYMFNSMEFQAFCSNICENIQYYYEKYYKNKKTINEFMEIFNNYLNNFDLFKNIISLSIKRNDNFFAEALMFSKLCQLIKIENRYDNYLKEIIYEHLKLNN